MIVLIDNYDSFSYNLYQLLGSVGATIEVVRNDRLFVAELAALRPEAIVLSPGPGRPADAGICEDVVRQLSGQVPILGVCLGHQAICEALGGTVGYAPRVMHGKPSLVELDPACPLFSGIASPAQVGRYHSLVANTEDLPACLKVVARTKDGEVMAVQHKEHPTYGLQFHPESILTPDGRAMAKNFINIASTYRA
ncbi:MAG: aminodeoxychorismate/anthranilate synthase component II [Coriobacteriales bacterium]|nr:aminodeoxychorismate/anthranilate synthase component II [Coriobacteriales bacterium]